MSRSSGDTTACSAPHAPRFRTIVYSIPVPASKGLRRRIHTSTHAHARTRTHTHAYAHTHARMHKLTYMAAHARVRTHTHAYARIRTHTHTYARTHACINFHILVWPRTHVRINILINGLRACTRTRTRTRARAHTRTQRHTQTHARIRTHACMHAHTCSSASHVKRDLLQAKRDLFIWTKSPINNSIPQHFETDARAAGAGNAIFHIH